MVTIQQATSFIKEFNMRSLHFRILMIAIGILCMCGCNKPDTDVTLSPKYGFASFAGTVWKTKLNLAIADLTDYKKKHSLNLLVPDQFDRAHPEYNPPESMREFTIVPAGTHIRIEKLMEDNGSWGGVQVTAALDDGRIVYITPKLLAKNRFIFVGQSSSDAWGINPDFLEK